MTTLTVNGKKVQVSDSFLSLSPEDQERTVNEIAEKMGAQSPAMAEGTERLSDMSRNPTVRDDLNATLGIAGRRADPVGEAPAPPPERGIGGTLSDMVKAGAAGVVRGVAGLADTPGAIVNAYGGLVSGALEKSGLVSPEFAAEVGQGIRATSPAGTGSNARELAEVVSQGGSEYRGKTTAGQYAGTVGEYLPASLLPGGTVKNAVQFGVIPGIASEFAGQMTEGTWLEGPARIAGGVAGSVLPGLAVKGIAAAVSPHGGADPVRLGLAEVLDDFGVPVTAGQRVGNEALRRKEGLTSGGQALMAEQREAFTTAVLKTAGIDAKRALPDVIDDAAKRIGDVFDDVTRGIDVTPDPQSVTGLRNAVETYNRLTAKTARVPIVGEVFRKTVKAFRSGKTIDATTVNSWRSDLSKLTVDPAKAVREAAQSALTVIDGMLDGAMIAAGNADDVARLATARSEWRNFLVIQKSALREGDGLLSPAQVRANVIRQGEAAYARGKRGDIGELARAGGEIMEALPNSGTPAGIRAMLPYGIGAGAGASIGAAVPMIGPTIGAMAGAAYPAVAGAIRMSGPVQNYLANQLVGPVSARFGTGATVGAINALAPR